MSLTDKLVPYVPKAFPTVDGGQPRYISDELRKVSNAIGSIEQIMAALEISDTGVFFTIANNLSEVADAALLRTNIGISTVGHTGAYSDLSGTPTLGTAAAQNVGTAVGDVVQMAAGPKLPAIDGSALTNLGISTVGHTGAYSDLTGLPTLGSAAALNAGTAVNNLVQMATGPKLPAIDGSALTNLPVNGQPIPSSSPLPVGCVALCMNNGAVTADGATIAGASLTLAFWNSSSGTIQGTGTQTGTWKNVSGGSSNFADANLFVRIA